MTSTDTPINQRNLVILDRDGVINEDSLNHIRTPEDWVPIPGSLEAIARLTVAGIQVAVATNQSGIARGLFSHADLRAIHTRMVEAIRAHGGELAWLAFCPHGPQDGCTCRKPLPGLLLEISQRLAIPLTEIPFVGDSTRDLAAAQAAGCRPVLVRTGNGRDTERSLTAPKPLVCNDLAAFVAYYLASLAP